MIDNKNYKYDAISSAKRAVYLKGEFYIPKDLRGKIKVCLNENGEVVIKAKNMKMKKITEKSLIKLGFKKEFNTPVIASDDKFYYFTYEINDKCLLISCSNDEVYYDGGYVVEFYEMPDLKIVKLDHLKSLLELLNALENE